MSKTHLARSTLSLALIAAIQSSFAADEHHLLEEVIVTAQKVQSTAQDTAASLSVISAKSISDSASFSADDILRNVQSVEVQGAARGLVFSIRGLGSDLPPGVGESSVSTNYDGVYSIRAEAGTLGFYDSERVEVLRGPQGTLYGRNATGGVINFISKNPSLEATDGYITLGAGNEGFFRAEAAANVKVSDDSAVRVAGTSIRRDGFLSNGHNDAENEGARIKYLYNPSDDLSVLLGYDYVHLGGRGAGAVGDAEWEAGDYYETTDPTFGAGQDYKSHKVYANIDAKVGPGVLTFIPAYQTAEGTNEGFFGGRGTDGFDPKDIEQNSLELRYASDADADIEWVFGAFYYDYSQLQQGNDLILGPGNSVIRAPVTATTLNEGESRAVFGQFTVPLSDTMRITAGGRYTDDQRYSEGDFPSPFSGSRDDTFTDWKLALETDINEATLVYVQAATGFRPGGVNPFDQSTYDPESLTSYEVGLKSELIESRLQLNASAFFYDYEDYQVVDFFIGPNGPNLVFYNADAENLGLEIELNAAPTESDRFNLAFTYLDSEITSDLCLNPSGYTGGTVDSCAAIGLQGFNFEGQQLPHVPEISIKGGYEHIYRADAGWELSARLDVRHVDEQYVAPSIVDVALQEAYTTGDITVSWQSASDKVALSAFVKNVSDEAIKTGYFVGFSTVAAPRTYGINATYHF
jgi:iron complex outermembrane receptor protein